MKIHLSFSAPSFCANLSIIAKQDWIHWSIDILNLRLLEKILKFSGRDWRQFCMPFICFWPNFAFWPPPPLFVCRHRLRLLSKFQGTHDADLWAVFVNYGTATIVFGSTVERSQPMNLAWAQNGVTSHPIGLWQFFDYMTKKLETGLNLASALHPLLQWGLHGCILWRRETDWVTLGYSDVLYFWTGRWVSSITCKKMKARDEQIRSDECNWWHMIQ